MIAYADTSFIVPLYKTEATSQRAAEIMGRLKPPVRISQLGFLEFRNAFQLLVFRGEIDAEVAELKTNLFTDDVANGVFLMMPQPATAVYAKASELADRYSAKLGTRSLHLMHLAAALLLKTDVFLSFDDRQRNAAAGEGLEILP